MRLGKYDSKIPAENLVNYLNKRQLGGLTSECADKVTASRFYEGVIEYTTFAQPLSRVFNVGFGTNNMMKLLLLFNLGNRMNLRQVYLCAGGFHKLNKRDVLRLVNLGLINIDLSGRWPVYYITDLGREKVDLYIKTLKKQRAKLNKVVRKYIKLRDEGLVGSK